MLALAIGLCIILTSAALMQGALYGYFAYKSRRDLRTPADLAAVKAWPKTTVVLSLRGAEASLASCLRGLMTQDYPNYTVCIVVDSETDSAWRVAQTVTKECGAHHVQIAPLHVKRKTCSLKCSALVQAVSELDSSCEILALLDADVVPHATWLKELVEPFMTDADIGATTGNRWFMPLEPSWAAMARSGWSAAALAQMCALGIPWGGSLAVRMLLVRESNLVEQWARSFNDDLLVGDMVQDSGWKLRFVPSLVMVNHEECDVEGLVSWIARQLVHVRFYHPGWMPVAVMGLSLTLALPLGLTAGVIAAAMGEWIFAGWAVAGCVSYFSIMLGLYLQTQQTLKHVLQFRETAYRWRFGLLRLAAAIGLSHVVYARSLLTAMFQRTIAWRGINYRIIGPWNVQMLGYRPHVAHPQPAAPVFAQGLSPNSPSLARVAGSKSRSSKA